MAYNALYANFGKTWERPLKPMPFRQLQGTAVLSGLPKSAKPWRLYRLNGALFAANPDHPPMRIVRSKAAPIQEVTK